MHDHEFPVSDNANTAPAAPPPPDFDWLVKNYFSDENRRLDLKRGEVLMRQDEPNDRLYYVAKGRLTGFATDCHGRKQQTIETRKKMLVGITSFFSGRLVSLYTIVADEDTTVYYIGRGQPFVPDGRTSSLEQQFMPLIVNELLHRQLHLHKMAIERERTLRMLAHHEKMAALGKISAGIAHELNNAIAVVMRNTEWLGRQIRILLERSDARWAECVEKGMQSGRPVSSAEARRRARELRQKAPGLAAVAARIASMPLDGDELEPLLKLPPGDLEAMHAHWETGATLKDTLLAAEHATHVVKSIRELGAPQSERKPGVQINETIQEAVTLLSSTLRRFEVHLELEPLPTIFANKGELVQVWINIVQNACESMAAANTPNPAVRIASGRAGRKIRVTIEDNGPGIPDNLLPRIFDPNVTTKRGGLTFGLGLGLSIVDRIVSQYGGKINVESRPGCTQFAIDIPIDIPSGGDDE